ncbi:MAG: hypoxanthine phosphoribosyltransferase [Eubacteriales bacterium]
MSDNNTHRKLPDAIERVLISEEQIEAGVKKVARELERCYKDEKILLVGILKGSVIFLSDLMRELDIDAELAFMQASSYGASTVSSGSVNIKLDLDIKNLEEYHVVIVEDVIDTGFTMAYLSVHLRSKGAKSVSLCSLLDKPTRRRVPIKADFIGYEIPDDFVVGYGLDFNGHYRGLPFVGVLKREVYE